MKKDILMVSKAITKTVLMVLFLAIHGCGSSFSGGPYQATGIKIGEVTDKTAIVWTRLTRHPERIGSGAPMPEILYYDSRTGKPIKKSQGRPNRTPVVNFPGGSTIETIEGAVPGASGKVRVLYRVEGASNWNATDVIILISSN
jgi:alkaline phosphatase D